MLKDGLHLRQVPYVAILSGILLQALFICVECGVCHAGASGLLSTTPPAELDLYTGYYNWSYLESIGDKDAAGMIPIRGRILEYWGHLVYGADLAYETTFNGTYSGFLQNVQQGTATPYSVSMAETMFQGSGHLGGSVVFLGGRWDLWGSIGYHQQIWMTPAPLGYEEIYRIPYIGINLYNQTPLSESIVLFSEIGYRAGISPNVTIGVYDNPTLALGGATNFHSKIGLRYYFTQNWALSIAMAYSNWAFTQSNMQPIPNTNPPLAIQEPDSTTTWWGPEIGVVFNF
ncbi:MAG: hypothetical protein ACYC9S_02475 [Leptospirales bacterium]